MTKDAVLRTGDHELELDLVESAEGNEGLRIGNLLKETGQVTYDPGFANTASLSSAITYIDGDEGILRYRGYDIAELTEKSTFVEVSYLLIYGELPTPQQLAEFDGRLREHTLLHEDMRRFFQAFPYDAHPMPMVSSAIAAMSTFYQDSLSITDEAQIDISTARLLAKMPTIAAFAHRHAEGVPVVFPDNNLGLVENFLRVNFGFPSEKYEVDPLALKALDQLFILHADHEQNCSTSTVRLVGSSQANMYQSISAGIHALAGPLHGGANSAVLEMLEEIQASDDGPKKFMERVKDKEDGVRLMGFGHRVYKNYDPRATIIKKTADEVLEKLGGNDEIAAAGEGPRGDRARGRLLRRAQALPERRLLHGPHLQGPGLPDEHVHRAVRRGPSARLDRAVARGREGCGDEDRPPAPDLHRCTAASTPRQRTAEAEASSSLSL